MNSDMTDGKWKELKGKVRQQWGKLTDDEAEQARGNRDEFFGKVQKKYGETKEEVEEKFDKMLKEITDKVDDIKEDHKKSA